MASELTPEEIHLMWRAGLVTTFQAVAMLRNVQLREAGEYLEKLDRPEPPEEPPRDP